MSETALGGWFPAEKNRLEKSISLQANSQKNVCLSEKNDWVSWVAGCLSLTRKASPRPTVGRVPQKNVLKSFTVRYYSYEEYKGRVT